MKNMPNIFVCKQIVVMFSSLAHSNVFYSNFTVGRLLQPMSYLQGKCLSKCLFLWV